MAEVKWQARRVSDGVLVDVTGDVSGSPAGAPTANALEASAAFLYSASVTLTDAQIKALPTTQVEVVAGVAGKTIVPIFTWLHLDWTANYTGINAAAILSLIYDFNSSGTYASAQLLEADGAGSTHSVSGLLAGGGDDVNAQLGPPHDIGTGVLLGRSKLYDIPDCLGLGLFLKVRNGGPSVAFTGGNAANLLTATVWYGLF